MSSDKERLTLPVIEIPERSSKLPQPAAIGLTEAVHPEGPANPFDISATFSRSASSYLKPQSETPATLADTTLKTTKS